MRKKGLLAVCCLSLMVCVGAYANGEEFSWKEFLNSSGETVYYPVSESAIPKQNTDDIKAPDTAKIGDIFRGEDGYERVIAVGSDGSYVTEMIPPEKEGD